MSDIQSLLDQAAHSFGQPRMKLLEQAAHLSERAFKSGQTDKKELQLYLSAIRRYQSTYRISDSGFSLCAVRIAQKLYELDGVGEVTTLATKQSSVATESGTLQIADAHFVNDREYDPKRVVAQMNHGELFLWGTGGDGTFDVIIRLVDSKIPVPTQKEYRIVTGATPLGWLHVRSSEVVVTDMAYDSKHSTARLKLKPGNYQVGVFARDIPDKFYGYLVVLCPLISEEKPVLAEEPQLDIEW